LAKREERKYEDREQEGVGIVEESGSEKGVPAVNVEQRPGKSLEI
jgi:hypothetical protein